MICDIITPGDRMELIRMNQNMDKNSMKKHYNSKVLDLVDEETLKISMPVDNFQINSLEIGEKYQFHFYTGKGLFHCNGEMKERYKEGQNSVLVVKIESDLEKFHKRQYYRLEYLMDIQYHIIYPEEENFLTHLLKDTFENDMEKDLCQKTYDGIRNQWDLAKVVDISGGGCKFNSNSKLEKNQRIQIKIHYFYQGEDINSLYNSKVIYSNEIQKRKGWFEHRVEFFKINVKERETLIRFIFEEERKIRRKERRFGG